MGHEIEILMSIDRLRTKIITSTEYTSGRRVTKKRTHPKPKGEASMKMQTN